MKQYEAPLMQVETLLADAAIAAIKLSNNDGKVWDDEDDYEETPEV